MPSTEVTLSYTPRRVLFRERQARSKKTSKEATVTAQTGEIVVGCGGAWLYLEEEPGFTGFADGQKVAPGGLV